MGTFWFLFYNFLFLPFFWLGARLISPFNRKIKEGIRCRKGWFRTLQREIKRLKRRRRILFHCSSAGEWVQAVPIIEKIGKTNSDIDIVASFLSPSGYNFFKSHPNLALKTYLPFDTRRNAVRFLKTVRPDLWVISKYDAWPNHMAVAKKLKIPVVMISSLLSEKSGRDKGISRPLHKQVYRDFRYIFPVSDRDRNRLLKIFPFPDRLFAAGSTAFDYAYGRSLAFRTEEKIPIFKNGRSDNEVVLIGGSIWPSDEVHLMPAIIEMLIRFEHLKVILVSHEPDERHIRSIEAKLASANLTCQRYTEFVKTGGTKERIAIIDRVGKLAKLYGQTDIAYVGGSCGPGVHNVTEPAVFGQPVLFGPRYRNSFEAIELTNAQCGFAVEGKGELAKKLDCLIRDRSLRARIGKRALNLVKKNVGATDRILAILQNRFDFLR